MIEWIEVKEELPNDVDLEKAFVWAFSGGSQQILKWKYAKSILNESVIDVQPTHWRECFPSPLKTRWNPKDEETYFSINKEGNIEKDNWINRVQECRLERSFLGVYKSQAEALHMSEEIAKFVETRIGVS